MQFEHFLYIPDALCNERRSQILVIFTMNYLCLTPFTSFSQIISFELFSSGPCMAVTEAQCYCLNFA